MERVLDDAVVAFAFCFIASVIFGSLRKYLVVKTQGAVQQKMFERIDSGQALVDLAGSDSGRVFLESLTLDRAEPVSAFGRILRGVQAGIVLLFLGIGLLFLHHHVQDNGSGLLVLGVGAVALGFGFITAAAVSFWFSRAYGLLEQERRG